MEWYWWLFLGLLIGWVVEWVIDWIFWRRRGALAESSELGTLRTRAISLQRELDSSRTERGRIMGDIEALRADLRSCGEARERLEGELAVARAALEQPIAARPAPLADIAPAAPAAPARPDPLVDINGIGPVYQRRLNEAGVMTFAQLATLSAEQIVAIIKPEYWQEVKADEWIAEALRFAEQVRAGTYRRGQS